MIDAATTAWPEVAAALRDGIAILPFGAFEQHGPHLPLSTDTIVAEHVARAIAEQLDAVLLPPVNYGQTWNNAGYPGTMSLSAATVVAVATDIANAVAFASAKAFVIVNGDWGNRVPLASAAAALSNDVLPTLVLDYPGMDSAASLLRESAEPIAGYALDHAGELETSTMLHIAPGLVRSTREADGYAEFPPGFESEPTQLHPFSASGVFGDPTVANAEKGARILAATIDASRAVIDEFLSRLPSSL